MVKYYTGVGSRAAPQEALTHMRHLAKELALLGYTLRSGGAAGSDSAFEDGCDSVDGSKQIFGPYKGFRGRTDLILPTVECFTMASEIHPAWHMCSDFAKKAHARNCQQVLGVNLDTPSEFLICWTTGGKETGGTSTAIRLAKSKGIPVFNLFSQIWKVKDIVK